jgi:hypothetical protein
MTQIARKVENLSRKRKSQKGQELPSKSRSLMLKQTDFVQPDLLPVDTVRFSGINFN